MATEPAMDLTMNNNVVQGEVEGSPPEQQLTGTVLNRLTPPTGFLQEQNPKLKMDKKVTFEVFREKVCNHIERTMKYGQEVSGIVKNYEDVVATYTINKRPRELVGSTPAPGASQAEIEAAALLAPSTVDLAIQKEEVRLYVTKKSILASNVNTIFAKVWGQCSEGLQNMIKYSDKYEARERLKDTVWLLKELKKVTTGIDALGNKSITYF